MDNRLKGCRKILLYWILYNINFNSLFYKYKITEAQKFGASFFI